MDVEAEDIYLEIECAYEALSSEYDIPPEEIILRTENSFCKACYNKEGELNYFIINGKRKDTDDRDSVKNMLYELDPLDSIHLTVSPTNDFYTTKGFSLEADDLLHTGLSVYRIEHFSDDISPDLETHFVNALDSLNLPYTGQRETLTYEEQIFRATTDHIDELLSAYESINSTNSTFHTYLKRRGEIYDISVKSTGGYENEKIIVTMLNREKNPNNNEKFLKALDFVLKAGVDFSGEWEITDKKGKPPQT